MQLTSPGIARSRVTEGHAGHPPPKPRLEPRERIGPTGGRARAFPNDRGLRSRRSTDQNRRTLRSSLRTVAKRPGVVMLSSSNSPLTNHWDSDHRAFVPHG
jgi:hypothetical protein